MDDGKEVWDSLWKITEGVLRSTLPDQVRKTAANGTMLPSTREMVMEAVFSQPQGIMLKDIAKKVNRTPGAVSQIIESLVREGMVERSVAKHDRRAVTIYVTTMGAHARKDFVDRIGEIMAGLLESVPKADREIFTRTLRHLADTMPSSPLSPTLEYAEPM